MQASRNHKNTRILRIFLQWAVLCALIFGVGIYVVVMVRQVALEEPKTSIRVGGEPIALTAAQTVSPVQEDLMPVYTERLVTVKRGDNMAVIFSRTGLTAGRLDKIMRSGEAAQYLKKIMPGDVIRFQFDEGGELQGLYYDLEQFKTLEIVQQESKDYLAVLVNHPVEKKLKAAQGVIEQSLFQATEKAGIPIQVAYKMADIFGWDIDFMRDIRNGDSFFVFYEELYKYGQKMSVGQIVAAAFENNGEMHRAVRYTNEQGGVDYYDENGRTLRKSFLRTPVEYKRISSGFSLSRKHPVLNRIRAHKGVDYAAPRGTPVKTTGDGVVQFAGRNGGYGRVIRIQHGQTYTTVYAHLSRYKKGVKKGRHVKQGETIGYVGSSGLATGPHLHYEFRLNGVHRNPLRVKFPKSKPVAKEEYDAFVQKTRPLLARIDLWQNGKKLALSEANQTQQ